MVPRLKQNGQAALEYILLLVLLVAICVGLGTKLYQPLKQWTDFYLGSYTNCLLDSGQLPSIAGGNPTDCPTTNISSGSLAGNGGNSSQNTTNSNASTAENAQKQAAASAREREAAARNRRRQSGSSGAGQSSRNSVGGTSHNIGAEESSDDHVTSLGGFGGSDPLRRRRNYTEARPPRTRIIRGLLDNEKEMLERREERITRVKGDFGQQRRAKTLPFKPPEPRRIASVEDKGIQFGIGGIFRLLMIIGIIGAVIYVVGSQLNTISKSSDK
jgi:hypothetical protein